jgi:hypothetical protein
MQLASEAEEGNDADRQPVEGDSAVDPDTSSAPARSPSDRAESTSPAAAPDVVLPPRQTSILDQVDDAIRSLDLSTPPPLRGCGEPLPVDEQVTAANARRKALLLLSDGADMDSEAGFYDALGAARAASVPVFPVAMGYANSDPGLREHLAELARATGGRLIANTQPGALAESYDEVVALLRSYYLIGYDPGSTSPAEANGRARWHDVRVDLRRPNFEPLVRPGYYR